MGTRGTVVNGEACAASRITKLYYKATSSKKFRLLLNETRHWYSIFEKLIDVTCLREMFAGKWCMELMHSTKPWWFESEKCYVRFLPPLIIELEEMCFSVNFIIIFVRLRIDGNSLGNVSMKFTMKNNLENIYEKKFIINRIVFILTAINPIVIFDQD